MNDETLHAIVARYGPESQWAMALGECGEFIALEGRRIQGRLKPCDVIDEIADVTIMMRQMALIYGAEKVEARVKYKLDHMVERMK